MNRIVCAGMVRSGSTWLYNVVRMMFANQGSVYSCWVGDYDAKNPAQYHIVKAHGFFLNLATNAVVLTSHRDLRDVAASLVKMKWMKPNEQRVKRRLDNATRNHVAYVECAALNMNYEEMAADKVAMIGKIAASLEISLSPERIEQLHRCVDSLEEPKQEMDEVTRLVPGHRNTNGEIGYYSRVLSEGLVRFIEQNYNQWMVANGYLSGGL